MPTVPGHRIGLDPYGVGHRVLVAFAIFVAVLMVVPAFFVVPVSFADSRFMIFPPKAYSLRWYEAYFAIPEWTRATGYSVVLASLTTLLTLALGLPAGLGLVRGRFRGKQLMTILFLSPLVIPVILIAMAQFFFLSRLGLIGTTLGLVVAHSVFALPFVVIILVATLRGLDRSYELAALSLGAPPLAVFWHVTLPLIRPGVVSAALLAFLASFNEFLISLFVIGSSGSTLPIQFWKGIRFETNPTIAAVASMLIGLTVTTLVLLEYVRWLSRRRQRLAEEPSP